MLRELDMTLVGLIFKGAFSRYHMGTWVESRGMNVDLRVFHII